jgi:hypothetical protein
MAFDFIISETIYLHQFSDLLWSCNLRSAQLLKSIDKFSVELRRPTSPGLPLSLSRLQRRLRIVGRRVTITEHDAPFILFTCFITSLIVIQTTMMISFLRVTR